ncbi:MAG: hypothetical protein WC725_04905 [Patescibacteria group bacterium]|jgi:hypothetical protein
MSDNIRHRISYIQDTTDQLWEAIINKEHSKSCELTEILAKQSKELEIAIEKELGNG